MLPPASSHPSPRPSYRYYAMGRVLCDAGAVLTSRYPDKGPKLMSYLRTIVHAQRTFSGEGWVTYNLAYHRQAAILKTLNWSQIDFNRYNEIFTGRAKPLPCCRYCMSETHCSEECRYAPEPPPAKQGSQ